jgi:hypothetical protein
VIAVQVREENQVDVGRGQALSAQIWIKGLYG